MPQSGFAQFNLFQNAPLESLLELGQTLAAQIEKLTRLQVQVGFEASRQVLAATRTFIAVHDTEDLNQWQKEYLQPDFEKAAELARQQYGVLVETRELIEKACRHSSQDAARQFLASLDQLEAQTPPGFGEFFSAIRKAVNAQIDSPIVPSVTPVAEQTVQNAARKSSMTKTKIAA